MTIPTLETIASYLTIIIAVMGAVTAAFWLGLVIWAFRDMRLRSRDPFAQILAALMAAALPFVGILLYLILRPPETLAERYERALEEEALLQEIEERPRCPKCNRVAAENWALCPSCQTELKKQCATCHNLLELGWKRCPYCTAPQPAQRAPLTPALLARAPQVTVRPTPATAPMPLSPAVLPAPVPAPTAAKPATQQRRYRSAEVGGEQPGRPQVVPGKLIVGDSHPTVVKLPETGRSAQETPAAVYRRQALGNADPEATQFTESPLRPKSSNGKGTASSD